MFVCHVSRRLFLSMHVCLIRLSACSVKNRTNPTQVMSAIQSHENSAALLFIAGLAIHVPYLLLIRYVGSVQCAARTPVVVWLVVAVCVWLNRL